MKNKKGFTLIELLAVIVILAIIALIATPIILNMIENAKKGAAKDSAYGYIEAIDFQNSMSGIDNEKYKMVGPGQDLDVTGLDVKVKGTRPTSGTVTIDSSGRVINAELCINNYIVTYDGQTATTGSKCGETEDEVVVKNNTILDKAKSLVYKDGICKTDGTTYSYMGGCYIKGASTNNYVWYNGFMWRIMGINSDNTVRLITNEIVTSIAYSSSSAALTYATNEDYIHDWLNTYFLGNLNDTKSIIKKGKYFCSETIGSTLTDESVRTTCTNGKEVEASVGMISYDEYYLADLSSSYLNIGQYFWTMTPYSAPYAWNVYSSGYISNSTVTTANGVRPVINVDATSTITEGDGTTSNYYVLAEDKTSDTTGTIRENVTSGEYVKLEGKTYRVVSKETDGVKLILDGYYDTNVAYGSNNTFKTTTGIGAILNGEVLTWLGLNNSTKIKDAIWYQGTEMNIGATYKTPLTEEEGTGISAKVGLIRIGEMLSGQSSTILTKNYTTTSSENNTQHYWTLTKYVEAAWAWNVYSIGYTSYINGSNKAYAVRPVIVVDSTLPINGGTGTWNNPYEI